MRSVKLLGLTIVNFKSYSNTTVKFGDKAGLRYLGGVNKVEPHLGANGTGKSSLWDALHWCLYGVSTRGGRAAELASGEARAEVWANWLIDGHKRTVGRLGSPERITIERQAATQDEVDRLLGLSRTQFDHAVLFGQGVPLFYDLTVPQRGALLDELLDTDLWMHAAKEADNRHQSANTEIVEVDKQLTYLEGKLAGLADEREVARQEADWARVHKGRLNDAINNVERAEARTREVAADLQSVRAALTKLSTEETLKRERDNNETVLHKVEQEISELNAKRHTALTIINTLHDKRQCPLCTQPISPAFAQTQMGVQGRRRKEYEDHIKALGVQLNKLLAKRAELNDGLSKQARKRGMFDESIRTKQASLVEQRENLAWCVREAENIAEREVNPYTKQLEALREAQQMIIAEKNKHDKYRFALCEKLAMFDYWRNGFKQVRFLLMHRALARLQAETLSAAAMLGLLGWEIKFTSETETKTGTLRSGVQLVVAAPGQTTPREWSPGELQRVRLAVAIGLSTFIQHMQAVSYDFEVWDEPTNWLSPEGVDDLMRYLQRRAAALDKAIWVLDYRTIVSAQFVETWTAIKDRTGSHLQCDQAAKLNSEDKRGALRVRQRGEGEPRHVEGRIGGASHHIAGTQPTVRTRSRGESDRRSVPS